MIKFYINKVEYHYDDKVELNFVYNETLDSGSIIIPNVDELPIKRLDRAYFKDDDNVIKEFLIGTIVKEYETFSEPYKYKYTLELISPTIILQNIILPNISITQRLNGARLSIYDEIKRLVTVFASASNQSTYQLSITDELKEATENIECPEMQFNHKSLFEILNALLINVPAVVTLKNYSNLSLIRLDTKGGEIDHSKITNIVENQKLDEYCTQIELSAENVVEGKANTYSIKGLTPRSSDYIMTTDNCQLILDKPIYTIKKIECYAQNFPFRLVYHYDDESVDPARYLDFTNIPLDITPYVIEDTQYNLKYPYNKRISAIDTSNFSKNLNALKYKRCFLSYQQGSNIINNLSFREKNIVGWNIDQIALELVLELSALDYASIHLQSEGKTLKFDYFNDDEGNVSFLNDPRTCLFNITYSSQSGLRFRVEKNKAKGLNERVIVDNQDNSYVDSNSLYNVEKENVNRLGNNELIIDMQVNSFNEIPTYSQHFGDYYLVQSKAMIYNNLINVEVQFTKDFIRKNLYTGIKSKARYTSIAKGSEALNRQDLITLDYIASSGSNETGSRFLSYMFENLGKYKNDIMLLVGTSNLRDGYQVTKGYFNVSNSRYALGNNVIISFTMNDNYSVGMQVSSILSSSYVLNQVPYVDENGEFDYLRIMFKEDTTELQNISVEDSKLYPQYQTPETFPLNYYLSLDTLDVKKDNREIYGADIQITFKGEFKVIVFDNFGKYTPLMTNGITSNLHFFALTRRILNENDNNIYNDRKYIELKDYKNLSINSISIERPIFSDLTEEFMQSWGIMDDDYNVLICLNGKEKKIYFKKGDKKLC